MEDRKNNGGSAGHGNGVQGEGNYDAARDYRRDTEAFIAKKGKDIPSMAKDAEKALDGSEGESLKRAEDIGKSKARH
jgi:hypothetical protein